MKSNNDEYECQFWGFTTQELTIGLKNAIHETIQNSTKSLQESLKKKLPEERWPNLSDKCKTLEDEYIKKADEHFKTLETYILENFSIPAHILLEEDRGQRQQHTDDDKKNMEAEMIHTWNRINRVHFLEHHLLQELERHKEIKAIAEKVKGLDLPSANTLPSTKDIRHITSDTFGLEVEEAGCTLVEGGNTTSQTNHVLSLFNKKRNV